MKAMIRNNRWTLLVTSVIILLPMIFGLAMWDKLPDTMITHWNVAGEADGSSSKALAVFLLPCILLAVQWLCVLVSAADPGNKAQNPKLQKIVLWIMPMLSLILSGFSYAVAMDFEFDIIRLIIVLFSLLFIIIGNYMPKCRQNSTMGIKIKWTLEDEENWNSTHRLAGHLWVVLGILMLGCLFLPYFAVCIVFPVIMVIMIAVPTIHSYRFYRRKKEENGGVMPETVSTELMFKKSGRIITAIFLPLILIFVCVIMFTGSTSVELGETSMTVDASYIEAVEVPYEDIDSVELREEFSVGMRVGGLGSARLIAGIFENEEFGRYTLYAYTDSDGYVLIRSGENVLVIGCDSLAAAEELYENISAKTEWES